MSLLLSEHMFYYLVLSKNEDSIRIIPRILKKGIFHIKERQRVDFQDIIQLRERLKKLKENVVNTPKNTSHIYDFDKIVREINAYYEKFERYKQFLKRLNERADYIKYFTSFIELNPDTAQILKLPHLFFIVEKKNKNLVLEYLNKYDLLWTMEDLKSYSVFYVIYNEENKKKVIYNIVKELNGKHFDELVILSNNSDIFEVMEEKKWALLDAQREKIIEFKLLQREFSEKFESYEKSLNFYYKTTEFQKALIEGKYISLFSGWVPASQVQEFEKILNQYKLTYEKIKEKNGDPEVPVRFPHINVIEPFDLIVRQYGITRYGFINPLIFFVLLFLLFYGFMFADFGHGLILFILGIITLFSPNYKKFAPLVIALGIFAMIFGLLFGDFFGKANVVKPLLFSPEENFLKIIFISIAIGITVNITGSLLNIIQSIRGQMIFEAVFGEWGILSLTFYLLLLILPIFTVNHLISSSTMIFLLIGLIILGVIFKFIFTKKLYGKEEAITNTLLISTWFIEFLSQTMSFIRVGAFLFAHIALTSASYLIISGFKMKTFSSIIFLISWTLFVIILEGIVVFIQSLRLNFYEFFSKFFTGDGILYNPLKL